VVASIDEGCEEWVVLIDIAVSEEYGLEGQASAGELDKRSISNVNRAHRRDLEQSSNVILIIPSLYFNQTYLTFSEVDLQSPGRTG
jgi:hypothetical protein